jgi:muconolactone delta-isomerase
MVMQHFMIDMTLPKTMTQEFLERVPDQRRQVGRLLDEGRIISFSLAQDRSKAWAVMLAESEEEVRAILESFPLRKFMTVRVHRLQFVERAPTLPTHISLN